MSSKNKSMRCKVYIVKNSQNEYFVKTDIVNKIRDLKHDIDVEVVCCEQNHFPLWRRMLWEDYNYFFVIKNSAEIANQNFITFMTNMEDFLDVNKELILFGSTVKNSLNKPYKYSSYDHKIRLSKLFNKSVIVNCTYGYVLNGNAIYKLVSQYHRYLDEVDNKVFSAYDCSQVLLQLDNVYYTTPQLLNSTDKHDKFDFYPMKDSFGGDLKSFSNKSVDELIDIALADDECVAFNTYGYLKNTVCDEDGLMDLPGTNDPNQGLYIKKV